jgi:nucleoside-diphosphate-sugar epimerase
VIRLVIGAGYLGQRVLRRWVSAGDTVFATTRSPERARLMNTWGATPVMVDLMDPSPFPSLPEADTVLWAVSADRGTENRRGLLVDALSRILARLGSARLVLSSSTSVYGHQAGEWVDESQALVGEGTPGGLQVAAEKVAQARGNAVILRFTGLYGPGRLMRERDLEAGEPLPVNPDGWLNLIHIDDAAAAVIAAAELPRPAVMNVSDRCPVRRADFYQRATVLLGYPAVRFHPDPKETSIGRRINHARMIDLLGDFLQYPTYVEGLQQLADARSRG